MTQELSRSVLVIAAADGGYFAIPRQELEKGKIPAERIGALEDLADRMDTRGLIDGALLPYAEDGYYFALPPQVIERYRVLPETEEQARAIVENDVSGYAIGAGTAASRPADPIDYAVVNDLNSTIGVDLAFATNAVMTPP